MVKCKPLIKIEFCGKMKADKRKERQLHLLLYERLGMTSPPYEYDEKDDDSDDDQKANQSSNRGTGLNITNTIVMKELVN